VILELEQGSGVEEFEGGFKTQFKKIACDSGKGTCK